MDYEGGNVSAHATHLFGSTMNNQMLGFSTELLGLADPLHGSAAQDAFKFLLEIRKQADNAKEKKPRWKISYDHI